MHFNKLDLNLLVALNSLLTEKSVTKAAQSLSLSPSAMSSSLSRLRQYFGDDLLTQIGRKMEITPLGESIQDPLRDVLNRIECTILLTPEFNPQTTERVFSIFSSDYTQLVFGPHLMALVHEEQSTARFEFLPQVNEPHIQMERGEADLLIIPAQFVSQDNPYDVLFSEEFVCLVARDSKLAKNELTAERYAEAGHVATKLPGNRKDYLDHTLVNEFDIQRRIIVTTFSLSTVGALVSGTEHVATVHARLAEKMANVWPLEIRPLPFTVPPLTQCIQWHDYRSKDPGLVWLRKLIAQAAERMDKGRTTNLVNDI